MTGLTGLTRLIRRLLRRPDHVHDFIVVAWLTEGDIPLRYAVCRLCGTAVLYHA